MDDEQAERIERIKAMVRSPEYRAKRAAAMKRLGVTEEGERAAHEILFGPFDDEPPAKG